MDSFHVGRLVIGVVSTQESLDFCFTTYCGESNCIWLNQRHSRKVFLREQSCNDNLENQKVEQSSIWFDRHNRGVNNVREFISSTLQTWYSMSKALLSMCKFRSRDEGETWKEVEL